jgi:creatinine amidohydrolase/Fe(II)-dependent formamide hydrolase-like protein
MNEKKVNWMEMFPDEFFDAIKECPTCYMAYGPAEPHGVYNILGLDWYGAQLLLERAAKIHGGIVAPPFAWHIQEQQYYDWEIDCCGMGISLTSSIPEDLFLHNILYHIRNMDSKGFHTGILISGHYLGHLGADMQLLCDYYCKRTGSPIQLLACCSNELVEDTVKAFEIQENDEEHAGMVETSLLIALKPEGVDLERMIKPLNVSSKIAGGNSDYGPYCAPKHFMEDGRLPNLELGNRVVDVLVQSLGEKNKELLGRYKPQADRKIPSIVDTEAIWTRFSFLTRKYWQSVLTRREAEENIFPKFPGWDELGE